MSKVEKLEHQVQSLSPEALTQFRAWFQEFDWALWDAQIAADARAGKLDALADKAGSVPGRGGNRVAAAA
jgi:hypothetical protein